MPEASPIDVRPMNEIYERIMRRGARAAESGGLENRCTLTGTVGSNPTLSAISPGRGRLIGMAPRWKRGGLCGLCGFESRPLRQRKKVPSAECRVEKQSHLALSTQYYYQAPASVQSRTHEPRQDRKVATVVLFRCAAAVTGA
jgi:hypothetical protein